MKCWKLEIPQGNIAPRRGSRVSGAAYWGRDAAHAFYGRPLLAFHFPSEDGAIPNWLSNEQISVRGETNLLFLYL